MKTIIALLGFLLVAVQAQAQSSYLVNPGDVLRIEVLEDQSLNRETLVLPDGRISLPLAGLVQAGGRSIDQIEADIIARLAPNFASAPTVYVSIAQLAQPEILGPGSPVAPNTISVFMMGESANPGVLNVEPGSTLLQVLAASGGFTPFAAKKRIQLRRGEQVYKFNYTEIEKLGGAGFQTVVSEGDVIVIPTRRLFE